MFAEFCTVSIDTAKVRLQQQKTIPGKPPKYRSVLHTVGIMAIEEGPRALFYGVMPGMLRMCSFVGVGNGLYVPIRNVIMG